MTPRQMASSLKPLGIAPKPLWINGRTTQGYELGSFSDAFSRYLSPGCSNPETQDTQELSDEAGSDAFSDPQDERCSWVSENDENPREMDILGDLGDEIRGMGRDQGSVEVGKGRQFRI